MKRNYNDIFKNGENFEFRKVVPNDPEYIAMIVACKKEQELCRKRMEFNIEDLRKIVITI